MAANGGGEAEVLLGALRDQRDHVLGILDGLDDAALRRPVLPSGWSCLGLVRHLAVDVERFWFRGVVAGERAVVDAVPAGAGHAWQPPPGVPAADILAGYRAETALADAVLAATSPDAAPAWWPPDEAYGPPMPTVRRVATHVLTETACHAGHLDAVRELLDGRQWFVMRDQAVSDAP
jgi:hypothetical protein